MKSCLCFIMCKNCCIFTLCCFIAEVIGLNLCVNSLYLSGFELLKRSRQALYMLSDFTIFQNKHFVAFMYSGKLVADLFKPLRVAVKLQCCQSLQTQQSFLLKSPSQTQPLATLTHRNCRPGLYNELKLYKQAYVSLLMMYDFMAYTEGLWMTIFFLVWKKGFMKRVLILSRVTLFVVCKSHYYKKNQRDFN